MTAWLNMFLVVGYVRPLTELVALAAIGFGVCAFFEITIVIGEIAQYLQSSSGEKSQNHYPPKQIGLILQTSIIYFLLNQFPI